MFRIIALLVLLFNSLAVSADSNSSLSLKSGYEALMTYSVSPELAKEKFPGINPVPMGSLAGYLYIVLDSVHYHLVALPSNSIEIGGEYFTTIEVIDVGGLDGAVVTPSVAEYWIDSGLEEDIDFHIKTTEVGQVLVTIKSNRPYSDILVKNAEQGLTIWTTAPDTL